jgi:hypothetical protein
LHALTEAIPPAIRVHPRTLLEIVAGLDSEIEHIAEQSECMMFLISGLSYLIIVLVLFFLCILPVLGSALLL